MGYWDNNGKNQALADALDELIPVSGPVAKGNPKLEKYRKAVNVYYDMFNNGLCNCGNEFRGIFKFNRSEYKTARDHRGRRDWDFDAIMVPMDAVMDKIIVMAALEQDLL